MPEPCSALFYMAPTRTEPFVNKVGYHEQQCYQYEAEEQEEDEDDNVAGSRKRSH